MRCFFRFLSGESFSLFRCCGCSEWQHFVKRSAYGSPGVFVRNIRRNRYSWGFRVAEINDEYHGNDDIEERHDEESAKRCLPRLLAALLFLLLQRVFSTSHVQAHMKSLLWPFFVRIMAFPRWWQIKKSPT